nr:MAG TPA: hypothetical protein [Caudoviricetes sp.]
MMRLRLIVETILLINGLVTVKLHCQLYDIVEQLRCLERENSGRITGRV